MQIVKSVQYKIVSHGYYKQLNCVKNSQNYEISCNKTKSVMRNKVTTMQRYHNNDKFKKKEKKKNKGTIIQRY